MPDEPTPAVEIRASWTGLDRRKPNGRLTEVSSWHPDSPDRRKKLRKFVEVGNDVSGEGTHWIDVRAAFSKKD